MTGFVLTAGASRRPLTEALVDTWRRDPVLYYEDGIQADLERAREIACRY